MGGRRAARRSLPLCSRLCMRRTVACLLDPLVPTLRLPPARTRRIIHPEWTARVLTRIQRRRVAHTCIRTSSATQAWAIPPVHIRARSLQRCPAAAIMRPSSRGRRRRGLRRMRPPLSSRRRPPGPGRFRARRLAASTCRRPMASSRTRTRRRGRQSLRRGRTRCTPHGGFPRGARCGRRACPCQRRRARAVWTHSPRLGGRHRAPPSRRHSAKRTWGRRTCRWTPAPSWTTSSRCTATGARSPRSRPTTAKDAPCTGTLRACLSRRGRRGSVCRV